MARWLLSADVLISHLKSGARGTALADRRLKDLAVSALTFEQVLADLERASLSPEARVKWRTNITSFREQLLAQGGAVPAISKETIEKWGRLQVLDLKHQDPEGSMEMSTEERFVVATAAALGLIYVTQPRDWNGKLQDELQIAIEILE